MGNRAECVAVLQAGLYTITDGYNLYDIINNPERISQQLAEQTPAWEPGIYTVYEEHAILTDAKIALEWLSMRIFFKVQSEYSV